MPETYSFQGVQSEVDLARVLESNSDLRRLSRLLEKRLGGFELAEREMLRLLRGALDSAASEWLAEQGRSIDDVIEAWDGLATAWRAAKDREQIERELAELPRRLADRLHYIPDVQVHIDHAMRAGFFSDLVNRLPAARPRREHLEDLAGHLKAGLTVAWLQGLANDDWLEQVVARRLGPVAERLTGEVACAEAPVEEREPCGWCEVGESAVPRLLGNASVQVVGTWACPSPSTASQLRHRAVEGLAVSPSQGLGVWGPWAPTLWNLEDHGSVHALDGGDAGCGSAAISPDAHWVAVGGLGFTVWELISKRAVLVCDERDEPVHALVFSPDSRVVFAGGEEGVLQAWDLQTGTLLWEQRGDAAVLGLAVSSDGRRLFEASRAGTVVTRDPATGQVLGQHTPGSRAVHAVALSPDGGTVLAGGGGDCDCDGPACLQPGEPAAELWNGGRATKLVGHSHAVVGVGFLHRGARAATASEDGTVRLWDCSSGREVGRLDLTAVRDFPTSLATDGDRRFWVGTYGGWVLELELQA